MKFFIAYFILQLFSCIVFAQIHSPSVIASGGDYFETASSTFSITIGEPVIETVSSGSVILTQGFQQPHFFAVSAEMLAGNEYSIDVFPQPAIDFLTVKQNGINENLAYVLTDVTGKSIMAGNLFEQTSSINVSQLSPGIYLLIINGKQSESNIFRIIKE